MAALNAMTGQGMNAPRAIDTSSENGAPRDRWLLMRLLAAGQSAPNLADRLIDERGSLGAILSTKDDRLRQLGADSNCIAILNLLRESIASVLHPVTTARSVISNGLSMADSLFSEMAYLESEQVRVVFLDAARRHIRSEIMGLGSVCGAHVYPREIVKRALELSATLVILVHNHPAGDPTPSQNDIIITKRVSEALKTVDIELLDHLIVGRKGVYSFKEGSIFSKK